MKLTPEEIEKVNEFIEFLKSLKSDSLRSEVFYEFRQEFCVHCGEVTQRLCHCQNDE